MSVSESHPCPTERPLQKLVRRFALWLIRVTTPKPELPSDWDVSRRKQFDLWHRQLCEVAARNEADPSTLARILCDNEPDKTYRSLYWECDTWSFMHVVARTRYKPLTKETR